MTSALPEAGQNTRVVIPGPAGSLEGIVSAPAGTARAVAVVCHPHPLYGGTMDNKVASTLARCCTDAGLLAVRFNFRGVGRSTGKFDDGAGEVGDTLAVLDWAQAQSGIGAFVFAGFSFGAFVALRASMLRTPLQLVTIAPPLSYLGNEPVPRPDCPWLVLHGDADEVVDCAETVGRLRSLQPPVALQVLPGVSHFFHGELSKLRDLVTPVLRDRMAALGRV